MPERDDEILNLFEETLSEEQKKAINVSDAAAAVVQALEGKTVSDLAGDPDAIREFAEKAAELLRPDPIVNNEKRVGRNDPCPCGSGKKYKKCHGG